MKFKKVIFLLFPVFVAALFFFSFTQSVSAEAICNFGNAGNSPGCDDAATYEDSAGGGVNQEFALTCAESTAQGVISETGIVGRFCAGNTTPNASIIEVVVQRLVEWLSFIGMVLFSIMIALAGIQITTAGASPEALKGAKKRITLAVSSIVLLLSGRVFLGLVGITGRQFLGVPLDNFTEQTFYGIVNASVSYLQFIAGALAVAFVMVGGVKMMTSAGNPQGIQAARKTITYALIGFAVTIGFGFIGVLIRMIITGRP